MTPIQRAIEIAGSQKALATAVGTSQPAVSKWLKGGRINGEHVLGIVLATDGEITPFDLRPDIYPDPNWLPPIQKLSKTRRRKRAG